MHRRSPTFAILTALIGLACFDQAADRTDITFADGRIFPESLTSTKNGAVYVGSLGQDSVYRAAPKASTAETWIKPKTNGLQTVLGVFADEPAGVLWVCASASGGRGGEPVVGEMALKAFNLKDGSFKASYAFPGSGLCNDVAVATTMRRSPFSSRRQTATGSQRTASAISAWSAVANTS
jgi:hypothetical protein